MSKTSGLVYLGGQYYGKLGATQAVAAKELIAETSVSFAPFVPFTRAFELKLRQEAEAKVLAPPSPQLQDKDYMGNIVGYEKSTQDPAPDLSPSKTMAEMENAPELQTAAQEIARLLRNEAIFAYDKSDTMRANKRYVGEVAFEATARDIFKKLPAEYQSGEEFNMDMTDREYKEGHHISFDVGLRTLQSRKNLTAFLAQMKEAGVEKDLLNRVGGAEITIAKSKSMQGHFDRFLKDGLTTQEAFSSAAQQFVDNLNMDMETLRKTGLGLEDVEDLSAQALQAGGYGLINAYEINQAVRRLSDMLSMSKAWQGRDTYIYNIPLHHDGGFFGHGYAFITIQSPNDWNNTKWVISKALVRESAFTLGGATELQLIEDLADMLGLAEGSIEEYWDSLMMTLGTEYVLGIMEGGKIPQFFELAADMQIFGGVGASASIVQTMTTRELANAISLAMSDVTKTATPHVAKQIEKIYNRANDLSHVWKQKSADRVWEGAIEQYNFRDPENRGAGVWSPVNQHWIGGVGQGFAVSPMLATYNKARSYDTFKKLLGKGDKW